jgi:hypothetical protein
VMWLTCEALADFHRRPLHTVCVGHLPCPHDLDPLRAKITPCVATIHSLLKQCPSKQAAAALPMVCVCGHHVIRGGGGACVSGRSWSQHPGHSSAKLEGIPRCAPPRHMTLHCVPHLLCVPVLVGRRRGG